jgi:hypothetical protein
MASDADKNKKTSCGPATYTFEGKYALGLTNGKRQSGVF